MTNLVEELNVYIDDETGNEYIYDGSKLILIKKGGETSIGQKGDEEIQAEEEAERNEEAAKNGTLEDAQQLADRVKKLKDALEDPELAKELTKEASERVARDKIKKELKKSESEMQRFRNDPIVQFENSLNHFLKKQMKFAQEQTYTRFNKRYDGTEFIKKGIKRYEDPSVPSVQVYFDRSGSWDEEKTKVGRQALATLEKYRRTGKLKIMISYFNNTVFDTYTEQGMGGTYGTPILADVQAKRPDNVIVMTDSDITDCREYVQVPGVVWYLFKDGRSDNLESHLRGKIATESFEI